MTYYRNPHPPIYYTIRTIVRCAFWSVIVALLLIVISALTGSGKKECSVVITEHFTWKWADDAGVRDLDKCANPANTVLHKDGTFVWKQ